MNIWRISCHGQSFPEANAADELSFYCIYSGRCPLCTVFLSAYDISKYIWEKGYQNSVYYHVDADRPHLHFVINPIDKCTGKQMRNIGGFANELLYFLRANYRKLNWQGVIYRKGEEI